MLICPRHFPGKNAGVGFHFFLQGVFLTQPWNLCLLHWRVDSLPLNHLRSSGQVELLLIYKCRRWGFGEFTNMPGAGKPAGSPGRMQSLACLAAEWESTSRLPLPDLGGLHVGRCAQPGQGQRGRRDCPSISWLSALVPLVAIPFSVSLPLLLS